MARGHSRRKEKSRPPVQPPPAQNRVFSCPSISGEQFDLKGRDSKWAEHTPHGNLSLHVLIDLYVGEQKFVLNALVDTGAEINVIKKGLIPSELTHPNHRPITMTAADAAPLSGGKMGVSGTAVLGGTEEDTQTWIEIHCPIHFYEAQITAEAILSYSWLANQNLLVNPRRHALYYRDQDVSVYMPGVGKSTNKTSHVISVRIEQISGITPPELNEPETPPRSPPQVQFSESLQDQSERVTMVAPVRKGSRRRKDPPEETPPGHLPFEAEIPGPGQEARRRDPSPDSPVAPLLPDAPAISAAPQRQAQEPANASGPRPPPLPPLTPEPPQWESHPYLQQ